MVSEVVDVNQIFVLYERTVNMETKLIYDDGCFYSDYYFSDDVAIIRHNCHDDFAECENTVCIDIDSMRRIILDYDLNYGGVDAE